MAIVAIGQLSLLDLNDAIISGTAPANPTVGTLWIDSSVNPNVLKKWDGTQWVPQSLDLGNLDPQSKQDINNSKITLSNMADDSILTQQERSYVKDQILKITGVVVADNGTMPTLASIDSSGVGDVATARKSAVNAGIDTSHIDYTNLGTQYTNLANYLNGMNPKPWDTTSSATLTIDPTTWRNTWLQFYTALGKLNQTVADKLRQNAEGNLVDNPSVTGAVGRWNKGTSPTIDNIDFQGKTIPTMRITTTGDVMVVHDDILVDPSKAYQVSLWFRSDTVSTGTVYFGVYAYDSAGNNIGIDVVNDTDGTVTAANTNPYAWSGNNSSANTWVQRVFYIMPAGTDNTAMKSLGTNVTNNMRFLSNTRKLRIRWLNYYNYGTSKTVWVAHPRVTEVDPNAVLTAAKAKVDSATANSLLADMSNDNKLTPVEKQLVKKEWDAIVSEKPVIDSQADTYGITTEKTNYDNAYNALNTYITPLLSNLTTTSDIVGTTFRANFQAYYDAKTALLKKISDTPKSIIDNLKIGGRNLIKNSTFNNDFTNWSNVDPKWTILDADPDKPNSHIITASATGNSSNMLYSAYSNSFNAKLNDVFTFSIDLKVADFTAWDVKVPFVVEFLDSNGNRVQYKEVNITDMGISTMNNGQWYRMSYTATVTTSSVTQGRIRLVLYKNGQIYIREVKVEEGNKATTWSPAPEDTSDQIAILESKLSSADQIIGADYIISTVMNSQEYQTAMDGKADASDLSSYATTDQLNGVQQQVDNINNTLSNVDFTTFATKNDLTQTSTNLTDKFSKSGGINLLKNSVGYANLDFWNIYSTNLVLNSALRNGTANFTLSTGWSLDTTFKYQNFFNTLKCVVTGQSSNVWYAAFTNFTPASPGDQFTASWYVYIPSNHGIDAGASIEIEWYNDTSRITTTSVAINLSLTNQWQRVTATGTAPAGTTRVRTRVHPVKNGSFWATLPQLEKGSLTEWAPSTTDSATDNFMITTIQSDELETVGTGSGFNIFSGGKIIQSVPVPVQGKPYTISAFVKSSSTATGYIRIYDGDTTSSSYQQVNISSGLNYVELKSTITPLNNTMTVELCSSYDYVIFTAVMLNIGDVDLQWQLSTGEVYNTTITMNMNGIRVSHSESSSYTVMTPEKFAGYYDVNGDGVVDETEGSVDEVFRIDKDEFVMKKANVGQEITMGTLKIIQVNASGKVGWAFVATS
jgi:hypothetical protein